jgi:HicB-like protein involved in pilus formation
VKLQRHLDAVKDDLEQLAALADEQVAEAARRITSALESSVRVRLLDVLSEAATELSGTIEGGRVEVRIAGGDPELVFLEDEQAAAPAAEPGEDSGARITLRLPESLKAQVEAAAARDGVSVNSWIVSALARSISTEGTRRPTGAGRRRLTGYGRS